MNINVRPNRGTKNVPQVRQDGFYVCLPARAKFLTFVRAAARSFPSTTVPRHTSRAGLWARVRVMVRVMVDQDGCLVRNKVVPPAAAMQQEIQQTCTGGTAKNMFATHRDEQDKDL